MSADLAIAAITQALKQRLQSALNRAEGLGAEVKTDRPDRLADATAPVVNLYLYEALINPFQRNDDLDPQIVRGLNPPQATQVQTWTVPLKLHYLVSYYGDERALTPQRLMAVCVAALHRNAVLTREAVLSAARAQFPGLQADALVLEDLALAFMNVTLEESYRLWSSFKASYQLSTVYEVTTAIVASAPVDTPVDLVEAPVVRVAATVSSAPAAPQPPDPSPEIPPDAPPQDA